RGASRGGRAIVVAGTSTMRGSWRAEVWRANAPRSRAVAWSEATRLCARCGEDASGRFAVASLIVIFCPPSLSLRLAGRVAAPVRLADGFAIFRQPLAQQFLHALTSLRLALVHGQ